MPKTTRTMQVSDSIVVAVDPVTAYDAVSDVTQMPRWSPENTGAVVPRPGQPAYVGMIFIGSNRRGPMRWKTECTVTAAERGVRFAFEVRRFGVVRPVLPVAVATWEYRFEPVEGGTRITETWYDDRTGWPDTPALWFDRVATGKRGFDEYQRGNIRRTLERMKIELERG
ncbi:SRPBCC family protein [Nocardia paucivorans]|uniref:SRPBCC family protein n=1 Tax=Nocardia paucivorans TaxID=114259 RepID=UPI0005937C28|nr:SRPBCC family protein [Nocardia paucivorans]